MKKTITLDKITNVVLLMMCLAMCGIWVNQKLSVPKQPRDFQVGQVVKMAGLMPGKPALILAISTHCEWCKREVPMYQRLSLARKIADGRMPVVAVLPQSQEEANAFLVANRIPGKLVSAPPSHSGFTATPTLLVLNEKHAVVRAWKGGLDPQQEKELLALLN